MSRHLWKLLIIHTLIKIDRRATVNISLPEINDSGLVLSLGSNLAFVVIMCEIRLNKTFFECLYVDGAVFEAFRSLYDIAHSFLGLGATIKKLFHNLSVFKALIGIHYILCTGC